ncbi:MAG TPA: amidohydrolase family protein [Gemmatimonadaceae bacterium]|nr:amidohydrolase family protein [Gemmatimonadaceae bacterium]
MRINGHAHIFNLHTVLTRHAVKIMVDRVRRQKVPDFVAEALERFLVEQVQTPEYLVEEELLARFLGYIASTKSFRKFAKQTPHLPVEVRILGDGLRAAQIGLLRDMLTRLSGWFDEGADSDTTIADVFETLRLAMKADVTGVAAAVLGEMREEDGLIALMMDITSEKAQAADEAKFLAQLAGTSDASAAFPGRVFPFVAVNTRRTKHFDLMREAIERRGFVGVKLYPSLGVPVDSPEMMAVYDYCALNEVPILMHCTLTGFIESEATAQLSNPERWWPILADRPELYVCFAHSGGLQQGVLTPGGPTGLQWPVVIEQLMLSYQNVYCDLAYHVDQMVSATSEGYYLTWIRRLLENEPISDRVIFGTDVWLVRLSMADRLYWAWFESNLTAAEQEIVMTRAPAGFLGLPLDGRPMRQNIERLVEFLKSRPGVGSEPAAWLAGMHHWTVARVHAEWSPNNDAHRIAFGFFRGYMSGAQRQISFEDAAALRLRQLSYWPGATKQDFDAIAQTLFIYCTGSRGALTGDYEPATAIAKLRTLLADGEKTLADAAATIDAIFLFPTEIS